MNNPRSIWNQMPMVRLLLPFMVGIGVCISAGQLVLLFAFLLCLCLGTVIYTNLIKEVATVYRWRYVSGAAVSLVMLSMGYVVTYVNTDTNDPHHISQMSVAGTEYAGVIVEPVVVKEKTVNALIALKAVGTQNGKLDKRGKVLASIVRTERSEALKYGDELTFRGAVKEYDEPKNPDQFDYKKYQSLHHIWHRIYLSPDAWRVARHDQGYAALARVYQLRAYFLTLIKRVVLGENELAVATAIMLGYRDYVTDDVTQAYSASGVLHVLSVSGLHVAVLYFVLNMLLGWMDKRRRLEIAKGVIVIVIMLFYAGLTGLSPPVLRSVWMFSLIVIARLMDRDISMYQVLGLSCFVLLVWDPYFLADVGFQLSYIAVAGIVYIYPMLFGLINDTDVIKRQIRWITPALNWTSRWTWGLICVSIAAQIATFPISVFYFHSFPNYFLLSNLVVIPLSNAVLISGMLLFIVGWSEWLVEYVGWVFDHLLVGLNKVVFGIDALPQALTKGIVVTTAEMVMLYLVIGIVCWYIADRRAKVLISGLFVLLVLCTAFSYDGVKNAHRRELCVYSIKGKKAISVINRGVVYYDFDSTVIGDDRTMRYNIRDHWYAAGVNSQLAIDNMGGCYTLPCGRMYEVEGKRVLVIECALSANAGIKLKVDAVILSGNTPVTIAELRDRVDFKILVFDTSDKPKRIKQWREECEALNVRYHDCAESAYVMSW